MIALLLVALAASACRAPRAYSGPSSYLGGGGVYGADAFDFDNVEAMAGAELEAKGAAGVDGRVGFRFHPLMAFELQGQLFDDFEIDVASGGQADLQMWAATANLKFYNDLTARLEPYALVGVGFVQAKLDAPQPFLQEFDDEAVAFRGGLGLDTRLWNHVLWYVETTALLPFEDIDELVVIAVTTGFQLSL